MTQRRRVAAAVAGLVLVVAMTAAGSSASAQPAPDACTDDASFWGCRWDPGYVDGMTFDAETMTLSGRFRSPVGDILRVHALLYPEHAGPDCPVAEAEQVFDNSGEPGPPDTSPPDTGPPDDGSIPFSIVVVPRCNDVYDVEVRAYGEQIGPEADESPPLELHDVRVTLRPPSPAGPLRVERPADPGGLVTVRWGAPAAYADLGPPPDFLGYRIERAVGPRPFEPVDTASGTSWIDAHTASAGAGTYRYRVVALRSENHATASAVILSSDPEQAPMGEIAIDAPPTTAAPSTPRSSPGVVFGSTGGNVSVGRSGGTPTGSTLPSGGGFEETLDYSDFEFGTEEAVPPTDSDPFLDLDEDEPPGAALVQPIAIASCLAMWAFHLRYLSRRADQLA
jgi:hypothetical protein